MAVEVPGTGAGIRAAREGAGLSLRALAAKTGISAGHLSEVERGTRPVTWHVWTAVKRHTGNVTLADTVEDVNRREFTSAVASAAMGALAPQPVAHILAAASRRPQHAVTMTEVDMVSQAAHWLMNVDLEHGGGAALDLAISTLRWAGGLLEQEMPGQVRVRMSTAAALLGDRAGWALYDSGQSATAARLLTWSLDHAARGDDPDLRAHIMLDLSTVLTDAGNPLRGVELLRMALGDDRVSPAERANLHAVCARHCGTAGDRQAGLRHAGLAEQTGAGPVPPEYPQWAGKITLSPGHRASAAGLALFELKEDQRAAVQLSAALAALSGSRARTTLRCQVRRAVLHLRAGEPDMATALTDHVFVTVPGIRSRRISADLRMLAAEATNVGHGQIAAAAVHAAGLCAV